MLFPLFCVLLFSPLTLCQSTPQDIVDYLQTLQTRESVHGIPPLIWNKQKGLFPSYISMNLVGDPDLTLLRNSLRIYDSNMFAGSAYVLEALLEAQSFGKISFDSKQLFENIQALVSFHDRNFPAGESIQVFWPQIKSKNGLYSEYSPNIASLARDGQSFLDVLIDMLKFLHLESLESKLKEALKGLIDIEASFRIPPDTDDSFVNLATGSFLFENKDAFPESWKLWNQTNHDFETLFSLVNRYSYQPNDPSLDKSAIDPRSYYFLSDYLVKNKPKLPGTWLLNITLCKEDFTSFAMPFNINNIDLSVLSNFLFGIVKSVTTFPSSHPIHGQVESLSQILSDSSHILAWGFESGALNKRPDLALVYYPSLFNCYWFASRSLHVLESYYQFNDHNQIPAVFKSIYNNLKAPLLNQATTYMLSRAKSSNNQSYFDEFLGNDDKHFDGKPDPHYDDRLYSSAVALNFFMDTWTFRSDNHLLWRENTPSNVKTLVSRVASFLEKNILAGTYKPENVFFSGSMKGPSTMLWAYPANFNQFLNGTNLDHPSMPDITDTLITAMKGSISAEAYEKMVANPATHFGVPTPTVFPGYNADGGGFPFWSSPSITYSMTALSLSKFESLSSP